MFAAFVLAAVTAMPTPTVQPLPTPPPEPNHITIVGAESFMEGSQEYWNRWTGWTSQASGLYEFQAGTHLRLSDQVQWERLSSSYTTPFTGNAVIPFSYNEYSDELDVELGRPWLPTGVGVGYYVYNPVYDVLGTYRLSGVGFGVDHWANWNVPRSFYYTAWYYPSVSGAGDDSEEYSIARVDVGWNVRASLVNPWGFRVGLQDEAWFAGNRYAESKNFVGLYVGITWWQ